MPACTGVAIMGSLQQPLCTKLQNNFCGYTTTTNGFLPQFQQLNFNNNFKPCKVSHVEGTLVTGNPSPLSSVPQIGGTISSSNHFHIFLSYPYYAVDIHLVMLNNVFLDVFLCKLRISYQEFDVILIVSNSSMTIKQLKHL
jgi:hypothetical protein